MNNNKDDSYLIVVDYNDDAERKRAEYMLDNWDEGSINSVKGLSRIVEDVDIDALYEKLVSKVPEEKIDIQQLKGVDAKVTKQKTDFKITFETDRDKVEWAIEAIMNKRKTIKEDPEMDIYGVYTKKGRATVEFSIAENPDGRVHLSGVINGYGDAPEFLKEYILEEIDYMI